MLDSLAPLTAGPWIYAAISASILLDVFLPVLPSGVLVVTAATAAAAATVTAVPAAVPAAVSSAVPAAVSSAASSAASVPSVPALLLCAATASVLGDLGAYRIARRGGLDRVLARSRRLRTAQERLGSALARGGGALVVLARFVPAGRSVVSLAAGATGRPVQHFLPWSALAGVAWATYSVGLGYAGGQWLGATWLGAAASVLALFLAGTLAGYVIRRPAPAPTPAS
ncbi:VTT domain-containing protein [Streptomyces sp. HUAS MG47]|uniref:DedA family protein n=1 Tax=Streptomyces solicamelliae TaxID=3231716 RepID=UPI003877ABE6